MDIVVLLCHLNLNNFISEKVKKDKEKNDLIFIVKHKKKRDLKILH